MYTLSKNLKLSAIIFMVVGAVLFAVDYAMLPKTTLEVAAMEDSHGGGHGDATTDHVAPAEAHADEGHAAEGHEMSREEHLEHTLHQYENKPWSAIYIAAFFFFMISLACLAFYAIQYAAQAGWSPLLLRVMEGITGYLPWGSGIMFVLLFGSGVLHWNHLFHWMDSDLLVEGGEKYDALIAGKSSYLNVTWLLIRAAIFILGWNLYRHLAVKFSTKQDAATDNKWHKKSFQAAAAFLVFFIYTESIMSWDWLMSLDPHWFSTLFGWYVFAGMMVCAITVIAMVTIFLKSKGYLEKVNDSHIHDLAKFMFAFSIFWTYLWFSQFMLIWYSNIPEEVTYYITRIEDYTLPFWGMVAMNFIFPVLMLMNSDYKRLNWFVMMAGIVILLGHYVDLFNMVMPATVGKSWSFGFVELGSLLFFLGLFILIVFTSLSRRPLEPKRNPLIEESKHFHY
ncbi:MAG: hypothetical protein ACI828_000616 [Flavobacteriales bacterium]|jgi:hypothetical protein